MSGKPHPEGVARAAELALRIEEILAKARSFQEVIVTTQAKLKAAEENYQQLRTEFDDLMSSMDLTARGNRGHEMRMEYFLCEIIRQTKASAKG
jgi:hypothetical protein